MLYGIILPLSNGFYLIYCNVHSPVLVRDG